MVRVGLVTTLILSRSAGRESGSIGGFGADAGTVVVEDDGNGDQRGGNAAKQGGSPLDAHALEHVCGEERETGAGERAEEGVARDGGGGKHEVRVDQIVKGLEEDGGKTETGEDTGEGGHDPVHLAGIARPAEPEETGGEGDTAGDDGWETPLRDGDTVVGIELARVPRLLEDDGNTGEDLTSNHAKEGQAGDTGSHVVDTLEDHGVGRQEEVENSVNEGHVDGEKGDNGLAEEQTHGTREVLLDKLLEVNLDLLLLGVNTPVESAAAKLRGLLDQNLGRVGLVHEDDIQAKGEEGHKGDNVLGPAPAEVRGRDETTNEGSHHGTSKDGHGEHSDGNTSRPVVEHVRENSSDDSQRAGAEEATEETSDENGLKVLGGSSSDTEDSHTEHAENQRKLTALQLGERSP